MRLLVDNVWARVEAAAEELHWLDAYVSSETDEREVVSLLEHSFVPRFPAGLLDPVLRGAARDGLAVEVEDARLRPAEDPGADLGWLHEHQRQAVRAAVRRGRGLIKVPTGGGKTEIFIGLTRAVPCEWLFVAHRTDVVAEAMRRYELRTGLKAGVFEHGAWARGTGNATVATFQAVHTAMRRGPGHGAGYLDLLQHVEAVNVDECHAQPAESFYAVTQALRGAYYRVGQSGTPLHRGPVETLRTMGALGPVVYKVPLQRLVDLGILSRARIRMVVCRQEDPYADAAAHVTDATELESVFAALDRLGERSWRSVYRELVVESAVRNAVLAELADLARKPCLVFVDELAHGRAVLSLLQQGGLRADFAQGSDWATTRDRKLRQLARGDLDVLVSTAIFQEGVDVPALKSVVNGQGKQSAVMVLQRLGRGMRVCGDGDDTFDCWDVMDVGQEWLHRHALERRSVYEAEGHPVEVLDLFHHGLRRPRGRRATP